MTMRIFVAALLSVHLLFSQKLSHPLHADAPMRMFRPTAAAVPDTVKVLAILVQFRTDTDSRTSGDGHFDLSSPVAPIIDAPPHDSEYVADHFIFAENYYSKASNGKQHVSATVLEKVITLNQQMKEYAPINGNLPLTAMIEEAWKAVDTLYPAFPFEQYDLFAIFHAGVGKDIDLRAALGFDPTPLDLPSIYFNLNALRSLKGNSYQGVTLKNSSFKIPNTVVLPETEVRKIESVGGDVTLKLGINGLLVASIGSHLGLPDLFDTKTGKSAIGRFGLMDGQSIFSYFGIAPPEPSAWEKSYLGWTTPIELTGIKTVTVPAVGVHSNGNDTIYKVPISAKEYFLIENRHRDAHQDSQTVKLKWKGHEQQKYFTQDSSFYSNSGIDSIYGVVLDVDELDWSLPGIINANNNYMGGILIWHIDETIIEKNLATNSVNADPEKRGVDVEEADGSQDIGQSYGFGDAASGSEDGSPIDYWFKGNIFPDYKNEFSETTTPNSLSNTFAHSHVTIKNFSLQGPRMSFEVNVGGTDIQLVKVIRRNGAKHGNADAPVAADLNGDGKSELIFTSGDSIYVLKSDLTPFLNNSTGLYSRVGGSTRPVVANGVFQYLSVPNSIKRSLVGAADSLIYFFSNGDANNDSLIDILATANVQAVISTPLMSGDQNGVIYFGTAAGTMGSAGVLADGSGSAAHNNFPIAPIVTMTEAIGNFTASPVFISQNSVGDVSFSGKQIIGAAAGNFIPNASGADGQFIIAALTSNQYAVINAQSKAVAYHSLPGVSSGIALANIDGDQSLDILLGAGDKLHAFNYRGSTLDHFPIRSLDGGSIAGSPVIVGQKNSSSLAIIFGTTNGHLYACNEQGKLLPGFPLQTSGMVSSPVIFGKYLVAASTDSSISIWQTNQQFDTSKIYWGSYTGSERNSNVVSVANIGGNKSAELLPKKFAYNWPNPAYGTTTQIRYFLGKAATVTIKIVNMAGELVDELRGTNFVGMDNEVEWNIAKIQSGIYFAQITASNGGEEMNQIVKIAVVK
ncbi:MAG: T9SS type A sorting domain-containing protein [Bacteriovoracaceae bacterium]|nr:T9SS type A sorting domain-containing protein [Bacteroidota bacterium]